MAEEYVRTPTMDIRDQVTKAERLACQELVRVALRDGVLVKPSRCSWCGDDQHSIHGHHPDYARPLMVVWICGPCHREHHRMYYYESRFFAKAPPLRKAT